MCGRFILDISEEEIVEQFDVQHSLTSIQPHYNIAPSQDIPTILDYQGERHLEVRKWGLVPFWAKDPKIGNRMINARMETLSEKPSFKTALKRRRCVIPTSGFYEWKKEGNQKTPTFIHLKNHRPFAFAGLWEEWKAPDSGVLQTCTIITLPANEFMLDLHHRMPAIFNPEEVTPWLEDANQNPSDLISLLQPYPSELMEAWPVSQAVNSPSNDNPQCIEKV